MAADSNGLRAVAAGQDGQFAVAQAYEHGFTKEGLRHLRNRGEVVVVRPRVGRFTAAPGDPDPAIAAALACWPVAVISHDSAARYHNLKRVPVPQKPHITVPHDARCRLHDVVVHRSRNLPGCDILKVGTLRYTSLARTVVDKATIKELWESLSLLDDAVARGARPAWINQRAAALTSGRDGAALIRRATEPGASNEFRSWLERASAHVFRVAHLPDPVWNIPVHDEGGLIGVADALWLLWRVIAEMEGMTFHSAPDDRRRDARRFNRFADAGYAVRRFSWHDVVEAPVDVAVTAAKALRSAGVSVDLGLIPRAISIPEVPFL